MKDKYQQRYEAHQKKKRELLDLLNSRSSQRIFNGKEVEDWKVECLLEYMAKVPSSCGRQAVYGVVISDRTQKELLGALLVGGVGWIHRANKIILLFAAVQAYKEQLFAMPYLDAGAVLATAYLTCEEIGIGCCFVNPNIREENKQIFYEKFKNKDFFCGALAIGYYDKKSKPSKKKKDITIK